MSEWKCDRCGNITDSFNVVFDRLGELPTDGEYVNTCPSCGNDKFTEVERCPGCGEWTNIDDLYYDKACGECVNDVKYKFEEFFKKLKPWEQDALDSLVTENASDRKSLFDIVNEGSKKNG